MFARLMRILLSVHFFSMTNYLLLLLPTLDTSANSILHVFFSDAGAPPKKPPRPGAPSHLSSTASISPVDSYNEGVKVLLLSALSCKASAKAYKLHSVRLHFLISLRAWYKAWALVFQLIFASFFAWLSLLSER